MGSGWVGLPTLLANAEILQILVQVRLRARCPAPPPGRPQGSHPFILTALALTKTRNSYFPFRSLCMGGGGVVRSGDPRGGVERLPFSW